jgi:hypothetical protein
MADISTPPMASLSPDPTGEKAFEPHEDTEFPPSLK